MANAPREQWSSRTGFVLAAVGSAVGLGNMWRFSYLTAEYGGAAFLVLYLGVTLMVGLPVMLAELTLGRGSQRSPVRALQHYGGAAWGPLGAVFVAAGFVILSYYSVIAGWTVRYALGALFSGFGGDTVARFNDVSVGWDAVGFHFAFMLATVWIVAGGVKGGIERTAIVLMPLLFLLVVGLAIYASRLPGAGPGYAYYLEADFDAILSWKVLTHAAGQAFFSLSLGMGAMLTYASYLGRDAHLPNESLIIAGADVGVAFLAGLVVFPLIFALGLSGAVIGTAGTEADIGNVGALFITLPGAFAEMGAAGRWVGTLFFAVLIVGALTSAISLLEVVVSAAMDGLGWGRTRAAWLSAAAMATLGIPAAFNIEVLDVMDKVASNLFLLGGALGLSLFVGWRMQDPVAEVTLGTDGVRWFFLWRMLLRFVVPAVLVFVLVQAVPDTLAAVAGLFGG
ncbi:MAG: sodium-dependent transporter [Deltaproteobacteria bacterium]|nr:sodium-dependent transporter [Deltaproteobacteria bacterium]